MPVHFKPPLWLITEHVSLGENNPWIGAKKA
jgi:hypothetical protein